MKLCKTSKYFFCDVGNDSRSIFFASDFITELLKSAICKLSNKLNMIPLAENITSWCCLLCLGSINHTYISLRILIFYTKLGKPYLTGLCSPSLPMHEFLAGNLPNSFAVQSFLSCD